MGISKQYIFTSGSLLPYRRLEVILNAYSHLSSKQQENFVLVVAGDGSDYVYKKYIKKKVEDLNIVSHVIFLGHTSMENMRILYRNCYVFVTATEIEACPNIAIEALSSGCYVLSSDAQPMPEIFGDAAKYFPAGSIASLNKLMVQVLSDDLVHPNTIALSQAEKYDWERCANMTLALIEDQFK